MELFYKRWENNEASPYYYWNDDYSIRSFLSRYVEFVRMKIGDLVKPIRPDHTFGGTPLVEEDWKGIVVGFKGTDVIVFWGEDYPEEWEYPEQLEVISESRP